MARASLSPPLMPAMYFTSFLRDSMSYWVVLDAHHHPCYIKTGRKQFLITLTAKMKTAIRTNGSPRHVPAKIIAVPGIPYTLNMKRVELAVRKVIGGQPISNRDALMNPEILDHYGGLEELRKD